MVSFPSLYLPLGVATLLLSEEGALSFSPVSLRYSTQPTASILGRSSVTATTTTTTLAAERSSTSVAILNDTIANDEATANTTPPTTPAITTSSPHQFVWNNTLATEQFQDLEACNVIVADDEVESSSSLLESKRIQLKRELGRVAVTGDFHPDAAVSTTTVSFSKEEEPQTAECIMKELEQLDPLPILRPAMHHSLNAHWSFVFTGVPTIGMQLITLLSRISTLFPFEILDFRDVALCVVDGQSQAKAVVEVQVCGAWEVLLEVCTSLRRPTKEDLEGEYREFRGEDGTLLLEHFQGVQLNGVKIPTPKSWHTTRTLEITYMDKDIMIARTSGGEPHLLLRNSPLCYSPEDMMLDDDSMMDEEVEECDLDGNGFSAFFGEAIEIYGERITRCLVDRDFGREEYEKKEGKKDGEWWKSVTRGMKLGVGDD
ncbi:hypothetical protein ACHAXR_006138 [Thalassiosira sp. AJA248-18]